MDRADRMHHRGRQLMNDHLYPTLRRWADGKVIAKAEKKKLLDAGLIYTTSAGTLATSKGVGLLQSRKDK